MSSTKFVFFWLIRKTRWPPLPLIGLDIFNFSSKTAEQNSTKLDRKQDLNVLYQVCVLRADRKNKMAALASDWLRHFQLLLWNRWTEFNETWQKARSQVSLSLRKKNRIIDMSVCKFGNWLRDRSLMISDILYIIGKGISTAFKQYFLKTKNVETLRQNTNFSIVHLSSQHSVNMPTLSPATTIKREIYNMRHTTSERPKESDLLAEKKKGGCPARFRAKWRWKKLRKIRARNAFYTAHLFPRIFERTMAT